jgi:hypothetical protein
LGESDALDQILLSAEAAVVEPSGSSFVHAEEPRLGL